MSLSRFLTILVQSLLSGTIAYVLVREWQTYCEMRDWWNEQLTKIRRTNSAWRP